MSGRPKIPRRARIFLGCEGESEQAYGALLQRLAAGAGLHVHIVIKNLQPAGDQLALAEKAVCIFKRENREVSFKGKAIMLDSDRLSDAPERGRKACELLRNNNFTAIWQKPDHEGLLLRHFAGHAHDSPERGDSMQALQACWPGYHKNMAAADLQRTLTLQHISRAAGVNAELKILLHMIGLIRQQRRSIQHSFTI